MRKDIGAIGKQSAMEERATNQKIRLEASGGQWQIGEADLQK